MSHAFEKSEVVQLINSVLDKVGKDGELTREAIYKELSDLHRIIEEARRDISSSGAGDITSTHIPTATDELDAVIEATAEATGSIMDACEVIEEKATGVGGEAGNEIADQVTKIYEACSFQDITGQRISKVVTALKSIELKVNALLEVLGKKMPGIPIEGSGEGSSDGDGLLNGPQLPGGGVTQADIDKLLEDFD